MEGSVSGASVPSDTILEVETWVKLSNFPAEFLTAEAISLIVSSFGSPVTTDEDTYEKVENHKRPPKLRRKLHSRKTFITILVRVSVTKSLPSRVAVGSTKGREYIIRLDFDPTPKVCLLCLGAGHFDFECCGTDKESVEIIAEAGVGFDGFCADFHGEQGAATTDGLHNYEDSTVVEAALLVDSHILPAASCDIGVAAAPELLPLLPASDYGVQGTLISEGSGSFEDPPVLVVDPLILPLVPGIVGAAASDLQPEGTVFTQGSVSCEDCPELEVDPPILPPAPCTFGAAVSVLQPEEGDLAAVQTTSDGFDVTSKQLSGVFHKWRDFTDDQGLLADGSGTGVGLLGVVLGLWCDNLDDQGMFSFEKLDLLQMLSRLVWNLVATYYEQVCFQIHHKWRDKGH